MQQKIKIFLIFIIQLFKPISFVPNMTFFNYFFYFLETSIWDKWLTIYKNAALSIWQHLPLLNLGKNWCIMYNTLYFLGNVQLLLLKKVFKIITDDGVWCCSGVAGTNRFANTIGDYNVNAPTVFRNHWTTSSKIKQSTHNNNQRCSVLILSYRPDNANTMGVSVCVVYFKKL